MNYEAEQNVIGSLLQRQEVIDEIAPILSPEMFKNEILARAYAEFLRGIEKKEKINIAILLERLPCDQYPVDVVGQELKSAMLATHTTATAKSFAKVLSDEYRSEKLKIIVGSVQCLPSTVDDDIQKLLVQTEALRFSDISNAKTLADITKEYKDNYFKDDGKVRIMTGMRQIDDILGGFDGGDLVIIGARPAVGKSAFAQQLSTYFADKLKLKVGYFNLEMQNKQIYERYVAARSGIEVTRIRRAIRYLDDEEQRFREANEYLEKVTNIVISTGVKKISEIRAECRVHKFDVVIIDYIQLVKADSNYRGNRYAEVGQISHSAKALAMDFDIPVIALCQLNRAVEGRETKEPSMSDLRESGDFEQDASTILLLWNTDQEDRSVKCIKVEKQRQGKTGRVNLSFDGNMMRFTEEPHSSYEKEKTDKPKQEEWKTADPKRFEGLFT